LTRRLISFAAFTAAVLFTVHSTALHGQAPAQQTGPDTTTATYGDWLLRCRAISGGKSCEVIQNILVEGKTAPIAQLAFGRLAPNQPLYFTAVLPTNVTFPSVVSIAIDEKDAQPTPVPWTRCLQTGCFASLQTTDAILKHWGGQTGAGRLTFKNGAGQDTTVPFSFKGLGRALDALGKD